jgi:hypothetical protein
MLLFVSSIKLIAEIALLALAGQWLLGLLAGANFFYQLLGILAKPFVRGIRLLAPKQVIDRHLPLAAFVFMSMVWLLVTIMKINLCLEIGVAQCQ